jgi:hypothetical protein
MLIKSVHGSPCAGAYISNAQLRCRERDFWMRQVTCDFSHQVVIKVEAVKTGVFLVSKLLRRRGACKHAKLRPFTASRT